VKRRLFLLIAFPPLVQFLQVVQKYYLGEMES